MTDKKAVKRLKNLLRRHLEAARRSPSQIFLELYAGLQGRHHFEASGTRSWGHEL